MIFVDAKPEQKEFLSKLAVESNGFYNYRTVSDERAKEVLGVKKDNFAEGNIIRMAMIGDAIIGFFSLKHPHELDHFFLARKYIGKGYGRALFNKAMRVAREELKWTEIQWDSDPNAVWFYRKMGAIEIGTRPCLLNKAYRATFFKYNLNQ